MKFNSKHLILAVLLLLPGRLQTQSSQYEGLTGRTSCPKIREFCRKRARDLSPGTGLPETRRASQKYMECMNFYQPPLPSDRCAGDTAEDYINGF